MTLLALFANMFEFCYYQSVLIWRPRFFFLLSLPPPGPLWSNGDFGVLGSPLSIILAKARKYRGCLFTLETFQCNVDHFDMWLECVDWREAVMLNNLQAEFHF